MRAETGASATPDGDNARTGSYVPLNEGRDRGLGNTARSFFACFGCGARSMRAETGASATPPNLTPGTGAPSTLNEGRDRGLGNTSQVRSTPEPSPALNEGRDRGLGNTRVGFDLDDDADRSMRAETGASATLDFLDFPYPRPPRSMRAETGASATRGSRRSRGSRGPALNEGRDRGLGNTRHIPRHIHTRIPRSMRAETGASATRVLSVGRRPSARALNEGRDRGLGNTSPVTCRPPDSPAALNEGRDRGLGNTSVALTALACSTNAQ